MSINSNIICPVCGHTKNASVSEYDCKNCGFSNAYIQFFAGEKSKALWLKKVDDAKNDWNVERRRAFASGDGFVVGNSAIAFLSSEQHKLYIALGNGRFQVESHAVEFASSERNYAVVYENGSVKVFGEDNGFGQRNTGAWTGIIHALAAPNCTYGITRSGDVVFAGSPVDSQIATWKHIKKMSYGTNYVAGLHTDGSVCIAGIIPNEINEETVKQWKNIIDIKASRDCVLGLQSDGAVKFLGKADDTKRMVEDWKDIIAISVDSTYAYGLSQDGKIHIAGKCKAFLDKGRSAVSQWNRIISISSNQSGVGAITEDGELYFAGSITGDQQRIIEIWNDNIKNIISFKQGEIHGR